MEYDVIIVGSGAGGGTLAYALASAGKKTLLLERGGRFTDSSAFQDERRMLLDMEPYDDRFIRVNRRSARLFIGGIVGGGTSLYGAVLMRAAREDFTPGKYYEKHLPSEIWDWPITYEELEPYYTKAESLMGVGMADPEEMTLVDPPANPSRNQAPLHPSNRKLKDAILRQGFHPYSLPLGIDFSKCLLCPTCPGYFCPNDARASTWNRLLNRDSGSEPFELTVKTGADVDSLRLGKGRAKAVVLKGQEDRPITGNIIVLSAGALGSPVILMRSGYEDPSGQLGHNFMYHAGALVSGLFTRDTGTADTFVKQLGFNDLYFGTEAFKHKLGYAQAIPIPGPLTLKANVPFFVSERLCRIIHRKSLTLAGVVEDLPLHENRVSLNKKGGIELYHGFHPYDVFRARYFKKTLRKILKDTKALLALGATSEKEDLHTAHQVGTARFGASSGHATLDRNCKVYNLDNLYIVDGSFMPTSLGAPPALTIMANALRVADVIKREI